MGILNPWALLLSSLIPILIAFYFFRKQREKQSVSALFLWEQAINDRQSNKIWDRLHNNLLLILQLIILFLLIFATLRPYIYQQGIQGDELVIILDSSASMMAEELQQTRWESAKEEVLSQIEKLTSQQSVTIIEANQNPSYLTLHESNHKLAMNVIDHLEVSYQKPNWESAIQLAVASLSNQSGVIQLYSDQFKENILSEGFKKSSIPLEVKNIGQGLDNLSLRSFGVRKEGSTVSAVVQVENESGAPIETTIVIQNNSSILEEKKITIQPNDVVTESFEGLPETDMYKAEIQPKDSYTLDNAQYALLDTQKEITVYTSGNIHPYVTQALRSMGIEPVTIPEESLRETTRTDGVYLLFHVEEKNWPTGPKLVFSPQKNGTFQIGDKIDLEYKLASTGIDSSILQYVDLSEVYLSKLYSVGDFQQFIPLIKSGEHPVLLRGKVEGQPTLLFPFDIEDSDWPLHVSFPILLQNSIQYLSATNQSLGYFSPGEKVEVVLQPSTEAAWVQNDRGEILSNVQERNRIMNVPNQPGLYELVEQENNQKSSRSFIVNLEHNDRSTAVYPSFQIKGENKVEKDYFNRVEVWRWLGILILIILLVEWEVYRRGIAVR
ncbi:VWA domain-containing protein [Bacillaceae bacterium S4-13-56]